MAGKRWDVMVVREGKDGGKSFFTKVGAMFESKDGRGFSIMLDALPIDGRLIVREPLPPRDGGGRRGGGGGNDFGDDDIPF